MCIWREHTRLGDLSTDTCDRFQAHCMHSGEMSATLHLQVPSELSISPDNEGMHYVNDV